MKSILIVDDHSVTRIGLKILMQDLFPGVVIHEAADGADCMNQLKTLAVDLCTIDLNLPQTDSFELLRRIKQKFPTLKILVISMNNEEIYALNAFKCGAMGFVSKQSGFETIKEAVLKIADGKKYISERVLSLLLNDDHQDMHQNPFLRLSERELEVVKRLISGDSTKEISDKMHVELSTVSSHKHKIFTKLQVHSTIELYELFRLYNTGR